MGVLDYRWLRLEMDCYFQNLSQFNKNQRLQCAGFIFERPNRNLYEDDNHCV